MSDFSDPKWWPQPPPAAPKHISIGAALIRGVLPLVAVAAVVAIVIVTQHNHNAAAARSQAAYTHCLLAHTKANSSPAATDQAIADCQSLDPAAASSQTAAGPQGRQPPPDSVLGRFDTCMRETLGTANPGRHGFGRGGNASAYQLAETLCAREATATRTPPGPSGTQTTPPKL